MDAQLPPSSKPECYALYSPVTGTVAPRGGFFYLPHFHDPEDALDRWRFNPYTGRKRDHPEVVKDPFGESLVAEMRRFYTKDVAPVQDGPVTAPEPELTEPSHFSTQVAGGHYKDLAVQPAEYCHLNKVGKLEGDVIYYVTRWRSKNGLQDLEKAQHTLALLIELERKHGAERKHGG